MGKGRGFTLIELMVTIAVLAIVAMMAAPSMGQFILKQNLNKSAEELILLLNEGRAKAALERKEIKIGLAPSEAGVILTWEPSGHSELKTGSPTNITFLPTGLVKNWDSTSSSFTICEQASGSLSKTISISKTGVIQQITKGTCS